MLENNTTILENNTATTESYTLEHQLEGGESKQENLKTTNST